MSCCYENPCNKCRRGCGKSCCEHKSDCVCNMKLDIMPHSKCTLVLTDGKCSTQLDLCGAIAGCQTVTHLDFNEQTGCIEYQNEKYVYSDGAEGTLEKVCVSDFLPFINLVDLNDVDFDDDLAGNCYELIYHKDLSCGPHCKSKGDRWINYNVNYPGAKQEGIEYIRGATSDGCPAYLDKPDNCSYLVFSPSCESPTGEWQAVQIPRAEDCEMTPDENGYYQVVTLDDCGCLKECNMPVIPSGMVALNYQRDSVPDDPDFPWYYGCYNDKINLHLADNAPRYFGKYDLKVTVNYGVQAIKSDKFNFNYNWRSLVVPVIDGDPINTEKEAMILQNWAMASVSADIPWGTSGLRGSFSFLVPKGREAYLHHEMRIRTMSSFPNYYTGAWDGQKVPDIEATLDNVLHPATRLHALQVIIEPTQGATDYEPVADEIRGQLDAPVDSYPQAF